MYGFLPGHFWAMKNDHSCLQYIPRRSGLHQFKLDHNSTILMMATLTMPETDCGCTVGCKCCTTVCVPCYPQLTSCFYFIFSVHTCTHAHTHTHTHTWTHAHHTHTLTHTHADTHTNTHECMCMHADTYTHTQTEKRKNPKPQITSQELSSRLDRLETIKIKIKFVCVTDSLGFVPWEHWVTSLKKTSCGRVDQSA